jgi:phospholipase C
MPQARWLGVFIVALMAVLPARAVAAVGIHKIKHVVIVMQENRSFDEYFGTFPGADGIPMNRGKATVCLPAPRLHTCLRPSHDPHDLDAGQWHDAWSFADDYDSGKMDGFARVASICGTSAGAPPCGLQTVKEAVGYHDQRDIPDYWAYARKFVLQDHMFEPVASWSLPAHLWMVSGWSALCIRVGNPLSCSTDTNKVANPPDYGAPPHVDPNYAWTDVTYLLHRHHVSWRYYVKTGPEPDCESAAATCTFTGQSPRTPGIWNPLPYFTTVRQDHQVGNVRDTSGFYAAARAGGLPAVSWVVPSGPVSEHAPEPISAGESYVSGLVNAIASGPDWKSTAIFLAWDDWGGFYDNVAPPEINGLRLGFRVPGLVISPYARRGFVDHHQLTFDAYLKFIEDDFLGGQRLNPGTDGRPDSRPFVSESSPGVGSLLRDFNFRQRPRPPVFPSLQPARGG